jgi:hypothetical protein
MSPHDGERDQGGGEGRGGGETEREAQRKKKGLLLGMTYLVGEDGSMRFRSLGLQCIIGRPGGDEERLAGGK